jgi:hypothetical protein
VHGDDVRAPRRRVRSDECRRGHRVVCVHGTGTVHRRTGGPGDRCLFARVPALRMPHRGTALTDRRIASADGLAHHVATTAAECGSAWLALNAAATVARVPTAITPHGFADSADPSVCVGAFSPKSARANSFRANAMAARWRCFPRLCGRARPGAVACARAKQDW